MIQKTSHGSPYTAAAITVGSMFAANTIAHKTMATVLSDLQANAQAAPTDQAQADATSNQPASTFAVLYRDTTWSHALYMGASATALQCLFASPGGLYYACTRSE